MFQGPKLIETMPLQHLASKSPWILTASWYKEETNITQEVFMDCA